MWIRGTVEFRYRRQKENDHIDIKLSALKGIWKFKMSIPTIDLAWENGPQLEAKEESEAPSGEKREGFQKLRFKYFREDFFYQLFPNIPSLLREFNRVKKKFYKGIICKDFSWEIEYGHENPALTALAAGGFWSMLGYSLARMYNTVTMEDSQPRIMVKPKFKNLGFSTDLHCIFKVRIGHIMVVGLDLAWIIVRRIRG
ncbi:MAG: DUF2953 domain-containing protein [Desulfitobacterium sp.]|nr:DUF2953 domain-containing protein [Desulfitobacterium sp.]